MSTDIRRIKTKENICEAFINLLKTTDLDKITVTQLANACRINKSTFYRNYNDKYDLMNKIINQLLNKFDQAITPDIFALIVTGTSQSISRAIVPIINFFNYNEYTLLILQSCKMSARLFEGLAATLHNRLYSGLGAYYQHQPVPKICDLQCSLIANNILTTIKWWHLSDSKLNENELTKIITDTIKKGVVPSLLQNKK